MEIILDNPVTITVTPPTIVTITKINKVIISDDGSSVTAKLYNDTNYMGYNPYELILWAGQAYIDIGNWTDTDIEKRIKELLLLLR